MEITMKNRQFKVLPIGKDNFAELRDKNRYYVDKTSYLKQVFDIDGSDVLLFTRPRRFGKTLLLDMFKNFLKISEKNPGDTSLQKEFFKDTRILEDEDFCEKYMGKFPVIFITLKDVSGDNFEEAFSQLAGVIAAKAKEYSFLKNSPSLDEKEKAKFDKICDDAFLIKLNAESRYYITSAIRDLALMLYKHFRKQVFILIDEYDVPLAKAHEKGYHEKMVTLMSSFLGFLKTPPSDPEKNTSIISKVVMTGCLKVAKNSIFTGVNNLNINTVISEKKGLTGIIGFTKDETLRVLKDYELEDYASVVKSNYDGYRFYDKEMFCPWDVIKFVDDNYLKNINGNEVIKADNYWSTSTSSPAVYEYLGYLTDIDTQKMQNLIDGKTISFRLNESMNYDCLSEHKSDDFWSLLLHTGYLTLDFEQTDEKELSKDNSSDKVVIAKIPNLEILKCFTHNVKEKFDNELTKGNLALNIVNALLKGDDNFVQEKLRNLLRSFVSVRDNATKAPHENFYHGFSNCKNSLGEFRSNAESGNGYADIIFRDSTGTKACVIEIKSATIDSDFVTISENALSQIEKTKYAEPMMTNKTVSSVFAYGIAFAGKSCAVTSKRLK